MTTRPVLTPMTVSLALVDDPAIAMRESMDDEKMQELVDSIIELGVLEPVLLKPNGVRFDVIAGHRRTIAARRAGLTDVPAMVGDATPEQVEAMKMAENIAREDVGDADQATYLAEVLEKICDNDFDRLVKFTKKSSAYINARFDLLRGYPEVFEALRDKQIVLSVATELNKFKDKIAAVQHLTIAMNTGATARGVREFRKQFELFMANNAGAIAAGDAAAAAIPVKGSGLPPCEVCGENDRFERMRSIYVHEDCDTAILQKVLKAYRGEPNA